MDPERFSGNAVAYGTKGDVDEESMNQYSLDKEVLEDDNGEGDLEEYKDVNHLDESEDRSNTPSNLRLLESDEDMPTGTEPEPQPKEVTELRDTAEILYYQFHLC